MTGTRCGFREAMGREAHATWGRRRMLWLLLALGVEGALGLLYFSPVMDPERSRWVSQPSVSWMVAQTVGIAACWIPMWLCSDLFATRRRGDCHLLWEWQPTEIAARAAGRLGPAGLVLGGWVLLWTLGELQTEQAGIVPRVWSRIMDREPFEPAWLIWSACTCAVGLAAGLLCGLVSASTRRSRRPVVFGLVQMCFTSACIAWDRGLFTDGALMDCSPATPPPPPGSINATIGSLQMLPANTPLEALAQLAGILSTSPQDSLAHRLMWRASATGEATLVSADAQLLAGTMAAILILAAAIYGISLRRCRRSHSQLPASHGTPQADPGSPT